MSNETLPQTLSVPLATLADLAVEHWRLTSWLEKMTAGRNTTAAAPVRYSLRKIEDVLKAQQVSATDLNGAAFDPGLAVRVVDTIDDPALPAGKVMIDETVSPLVQWQNHVVRPADVVTRRGV